MTVDETTHGILNQVPQFKQWSYLELGVGNNENFLAIDCANKVSVDIGRKGIFRGTTDQYFSQLSPQIKFDVIFIDACHDFDFVLRDFNNSIRHCTKWIIMHDMIPPTEDYIKPSRCSDCFRLLPVLYRSSMKVYCLDDRLGLTFVKMPGNQLNPDTTDKQLSHKDFIKWIEQNIKMINFNRAVELIANE
jgi:hypothetical protein